jgi:hypothetical protein
MTQMLTDSRLVHRQRSGDLPARSQAALRTAQFFEDMPLTLGQLHPWPSPRRRRLRRARRNGSCLRPACLCGGDCVHTGDGMFVAVQHPPRGQVHNSLPPAAIRASSDAQVADDLFRRISNAGDRANGNSRGPAETPPAIHPGRDHIVVELRASRVLTRAVDPQPRPQTPVIHHTPHTPPGQFLTQRDQVPHALVGIELPAAHGWLAGSGPAGPIRRRAALAASSALPAVWRGRPCWLMRPAGQMSQPHLYRTASLSGSVPDASASGPAKSNCPASPATRACRSGSGVTPILRYRCSRCLQKVASADRSAAATRRAVATPCPSPHSGNWTSRISMCVRRPELARALSGTRQIVPRPRTAGWQ